MCLIRALTRLGYGAYLTVAWLTWYNLDETRQFANILVISTFAFQAVLEIPSGAAADRIGRANTVLLGLAGLSIALSIYTIAGILQAEVLSPEMKSLTVASLIIGELFLAGGLALISGAFEALAIDGTLRMAGREAQAIRIEDFIVARCAKYGQVGALIGGLIGVWFSGFKDYLVFFIATVSGALAVLIVGMLAWRDAHHLPLEADSSKQRESQEQTHDTFRGISSAFTELLIVLIDVRLIYAEFRKASSFLWGSLAMTLLWLILIPSEAIGQAAEILWRELIQNNGSTAPSYWLALGFSLMTLGGTIGHAASQWLAEKNVRRTTTITWSFMLCTMSLAAMQMTPLGASPLSLFIPIVLRASTAVIFSTMGGRIQHEITAIGLSERRATITSCLAVLGTAFISIMALAHTLLQKATFVATEMTQLEWMTWVGVIGMAVSLGLIYSRSRPFVDKSDNNNMEAIDA